ncbi:hypothetical protein AB0L40_20055 [Patulibacter sp. NPDC049589]|uniref:hypothetical protein n=1 Tax=Patulibacter sp. NPDC049589 TaxID=3154731 RepID=UPI003434919C
MIRRVGLLALVLGVLGGAVAAAAIPRDRAAGDTVARTPSADVRTAPAKPQQSARYFGGLRRTGPVAITARVADPAGGDPWAVRTFLAERLNTRGRRQVVIGRDRCFQLGRIHAGRFGWIDDGDVFRPASVGYRGAPITCGSRRPDLHRSPTLQALHLLRTTPGQGPARIRTVVWGATGEAARDLTVRLGGDELRTTRGAYGTALAVRAEDDDASTLEGTVRYPTGSPVTVGGLAGIPDRFLHGMKHAPDPAAPTFIAARAPDPNGGMPYGIVGRAAKGGGYCVTSSPGRIVDGRVGRVDFDLGTFVEDRVARYDCQSIGSLGRKRPIGIGFGGGDGFPDPAADPAPGRVARRTLPGTQYFAGQTAPDVRSLTMQSPRDVRTLVPSSPAHAYLVVYDGVFNSGTMEFTARLADGRTVHDSATLAF